MNQREKILSIIVGAVVVILGGNYIVLPIFLGSLNAVNENIKNIRADIEKKNRQLSPKNQYIRDWRSVGKRVLSNDPEKANRILSERVTSLITAAGLQDVSKTFVPLSPTKPGGVMVYTPVAINLSGKGTLAQFVNFLEMFYQEPYIVKIKGFTLRPEDRGELMSFSNFRIETIVPAKAVLDKKIPVTSPPVITATQPALKPGQKSQYAMILDRNIFRPHVIAPPPPPPVTPSIPVQRRTESPPIISSPGDPNGRPGDVVGTLIIGKERAAYIRNQGGVELYKVENKLNNGMSLVYVHPLGIVLQDPQGKTVYVEIGRNIDHPAPLTQEAIPELYEAWKSRPGQ
jgi:hypothetical protein